MTDIRITFDSANQHHAQQTLNQLASYIKTQTKTDRHPVVSLGGDGQTGWHGSIDLHGTYVPVDELQAMINTCCPDQSDMHIRVTN